jgi:hypothetical protein
MGIISLKYLTLRSVMIVIWHHVIHVVNLKVLVRKGFIGTDIMGEMHWWGKSVS